MMRYGNAVHINPINRKGVAMKIKLQYRIQFGIISWLANHHKPRRVLFWAVIAIVVWGLVKSPMILWHLFAN